MNIKVTTNKYTIIRNHQPWRNGHWTARKVWNKKIYFYSSWISQHGADHGLWKLWEVLMLRFRTEQPQYYIPATGYVRKSHSQMLHGNETHNQALHVNASLLYHIIVSRAPVVLFWGEIADSPNSFEATPLLETVCLMPTGPKSQAWFCH